MTSFINDVSMQAAKIALDGLSQRQQAINKNIANVDTPGYKAQTISFENALQRAIGSGNTSISMATTNTAHLSSNNKTFGIHSEFRSGGATRADENNVDIDTELIDQTETGIRYQAVSQLLSKKLLLLKSITTSR